MRQGFLVQSLLREGYENVLGVDTSQEQVKFGKDLGLPVVHADPLDFLRGNKNLDSVIYTDVIEQFSALSVFRG